MKNIFKSIFALGFSAVLFTACSTGDLDPTLYQDKAVEGSITKVDNLASVLVYVHDRLTSTGYYGRDMIATNEVRSDNCFSNGNSGRFSTQAEYQYNNNTGFMWDDAYTVIANANIIIGTDIASLEGDAERGKHIQGQAMAIRALCHFDLIRVYGQQHAAGGELGVPYVKIFKGDDLFPSRQTLAENKVDLYNDLETAYGMMDAKFNGGKTIISKLAVKALESRIALYFGDWTRARDAAAVVIGSNAYSIAKEANFVSNWATKEASNSIFELAFAQDDNRGSNSLGYIYRYPSDAPAGYGDVQAVDGAIDIYEAGDVRRDIFGYQDGGSALRNMKKYPDTANGTDNIPLIRYEEVVLNYAEALFETSDLGGALTQLNSIVAERGGTPYAVASKANIILERRKELMFEGFRFDDMMRTGMDVEVLGSGQDSIKTLSYPNNLFAYPIPVAEINANSNIVQNAGY